MYCQTNSESSYLIGRMLLPGLLLVLFTFVWTPHPVLGQEGLSGDQKRQLDTWLSEFEDASATPRERKTLASKIIHLGPYGAKKLYVKVIPELEQRQKKLLHELVKGAQSRFRDQLPESKSDRSSLIRNVRKTRKKLRKLAKNPKKKKIRSLGVPGLKQLSEIYLIDRTPLLRTDPVQPLVNRVMEFYIYKKECERVIPRKDLNHPPSTASPKAVVKRLAYRASLVPIANKKHHVRILTSNRKEANQIQHVEALGILDLNRIRLLLRMKPLRIDPRLCAAARDHSSDMKRLGFFSHTSKISDKKTFQDRAANFNTNARAENIAKADKPREVNMNWYHSPGHHKNMLRTGFSAIGLGNAGRYWTQMFR